MSYTNKSYDFDEMNIAENGTDTNGSKTGVNMKFSTEKRPSKSSMLTKVLAFLLLAALIAVVVLAVLLVKEKHHNIESTKVCTTAECVKTAARVHANLDLEVDPCEDFYQFACGGWREQRVIPEDESSLSIFTGLEENVDIKLKNILETENSNEDPDYIRKARDFYASCMDTELLDTTGDKPLKDLLTRELGGWPLLMRQGEWNEDDFDIVDMAKKVYKLGSWAHFEFYAGVDDKNSTRHILTIDQAPLSMPDIKYYMVPRNDTMLMAFEERIRSTAILLGADEATARSNAKEIVDFEIQLANISVPPELRRDSNVLYNPITLEDLYEEYKQVFDWKSFVQGLAGMDGVGESIGDQEVIMNRSPDFFQGWMELLQNTPKRVQANYMVWTVINNYIFTLSEKYRQVIQKYNFALYGTKRPSPRYKVCVYNTVSGNMGLAVGQLYIKDNFGAKAKSETLELIDHLQNAFDELIYDLDWMDEDTKRVAMEKNHAIDKKVGYPEVITNNTYLEILNENYTYIRQSYFDNVLNRQTEDFKAALRRLCKPVDKKEWSGPPSIVNAYYSFARNQIVFPAGILQTPFFSSSSPKSINYGGIGVVIGHEITHGFDDQGRQYDKEGELTQWWDDSAIHKFKDRAQCLVEQYGNFTMEEVNMNVNGITTQGENIADNGGLRESFKAYRNWVAAQGMEEMPLPGLDFTHNQLFFLGFAQVWCDKARDKSIINRLLGDPHSPHRYRVIGTLQNSPEFSEAFKCKPGTLMNRKNKCRVW